MSLPSREAISQRLENTLVALVLGTAQRVAVPPPEIKPHLDAVVAIGENTIRDGMLTLLAMEVEHGSIIDWATLPVKRSPARSASRDLGKRIYPSLNIRGSGEALETGVKGTSTYRDRSTRHGHWEATLDWASTQSDVRAIETAFRYLASCVAATARTMPEMPELQRTALSFASTFALADALLTQSSHGAHEQFIFAAFFEAAVRQEGDDRSLVVTKQLNASDASARTAADVQHRYGGDVRDAYEVTSEDWRTKIDQAHTAAHQHRLDRIHILGRGAAAMSGDDIAAELRGTSIDISVLEIRDEIRSLVHRVTPEYRRRALEILYDHLVRRQPREALVVQYVDELRRRGLTKTTPP